MSPPSLFRKDLHLFALVAWLGIMTSTKQRKILVTGVTHGIGEAMLAEFLRAGHDVAGCARSQDRLELLKERHPEATLGSVDVSRADSVEPWARNLLSHWGTPDLLIHNAAVIHPNAALEDIRVEDMERVIDVNVKGTFLINRAFLPALKKANHGVIVNLSSGAGRNGYAHMTIYCASKWAVEGMTAALCAELPEGVAAVTLSPGVVNTRMLQTVFGVEGAAQQGTPAQWAAKAVPVLLSLNASHRGQQLTVTTEDP